MRCAQESTVKNICYILYEYVIIDIRYFPMCSGKFKNLSSIIFLSIYDLLTTYQNIIITFNTMNDIYIHQTNKYLVYHTYNSLNIFLSINFCSPFYV